MRCDVLLFAEAAERVGAREVSLDLAPGASVADALDALCREHPALAPLRATLAVAVNEAYSGEAHRLAEGDTLALIPPVSGG